jgi:hypothetical protein
LVVTELASVSLEGELDEPELGDSEPEELESDRLLVASEREDPELLDSASSRAVFSAAALSTAAFFAAASLEAAALAGLRVLADFVWPRATTVRALRFADAVSAGSCPEASCT